MVDTAEVTDFECCGARLEQRYIFPEHQPKSVPLFPNPQR